MTFKLAFKLELDRQGFSPAVQESQKEVVRFGDVAEAAGEKASAGIRSIGGAVDAITTKFGQLAQRSGDYLQGLGRSFTSQFSDLDAKTAAVGVTAKQTSAALRGLPAQMTDVFVGLTSGQSPLTVLIQQGGQVKDMFGGVGNAVRAVAGYVAGLISPMSVLALVVAGAALAYHAGSEETTAYNRALILSGNAAGATTSQLTEYARNIALVTGTQGAAAAAVAAVAQSGAVASENLQRAAQAALAFEKATGTAIDTTVKQFQELAKSPLEATIKLNEGMNFLTVSIYEQIKALKEQGKTTEAADLAQKTYADTLSSRSADILKNIGFIEQRWLAVKAAIGGVVDATLNLGRDGTTSDKINGLNSQLVVLKTNLQDYLGKGFADDDRLVVSLRKQIDVVERLRGTTIAGSKAQEEAAAKAAESDKKLQARIEFDKVQNQNLSKQVELEQKIATVRRLGAAAGKEQHEIEALVAEIRKKNTGAAGTGESEVAAIRGRIVEEKNLIARLQERGAEALKLTEGEKLVTKIQEELKTSMTGVTRAQKEKALAAAQELAGLEQVRVAEEKRIKNLQEAREHTLRQIEAVDKSAESIRDQASALDAANKVWGQGKTAVEQMRLAQLEQHLQEAEGSDNFDPKYIAALRNKIAATKDYVAALKEADYKSLNEKQLELARATAEQVDMARMELSLAGLTTTERARIVAERRVEIDLSKRIAEIDRSSLDDEQKRKLTDQAKATAEEQKYVASAKVVADEWNRVSDQISNSLTDALMRGFESGKGFLRNLRDTAVNMFKSLVLRPTIQAVVQPAAAAVTNAIGLGNTGSGGMNLLNSLSGTSGIFGSVVGEFTGILSNSFSAAIANIASGNGLAGLTAGLESAFSIAAEGGIASGAAGALGTIAPYAAVAYAAFQIADKLFGSKGGPKTESGYASADFSSYGFRDSPSSSLVFQQQAGEANMASARAIVDAIRTQYEGTVRALGGIAKQLDAVAFVSTDPQGDAQTQLQIAAAINGQTVYDRRAAGQFENVGRSEAELQAAIASAANTAVLNALLASDIPDKIKAYLGANLDASDLQGVLNTAVQIGQVDAAFRKFGGNLAQIADISVEAELGFIRLFGSIDNLSQALSSFQADFYSDAERQALAVAGLKDAFSKLDVGGAFANTAAQYQRLLVEPTRASFRQLVEAQDLTSESGRQTYAALLQIAPAFAAVVPAVEGATAAIEQAVQKLTSIDDVFSALDGVIERFVSGTELRGYRLARIQQQLASQGYNVSTDAIGSATADSLRAVLASLDLTTSEGRRAAVALAGVSGAILDLNASAGTAAAGIRSASDILNERRGLEGQLYQLLGNTQVLRERELAGLDESNRALQQHIYAVNDAQAAVETANQAYQAAQQAARENVSALEQQRSAMQSSISQLQQDAQRWIGLRQQASGLLGNISTSLGGSNTREADLWAALGTGELEDQLRTAQDLYSLITQTAQVETQAAQQALSNAQALLDVGKQLRDYVQGLRTGDLTALTPAQALAEAQAQYQGALGRAASGDVDAQRQLQGLSQTYLQLAREFDPGSYSTVFNAVTGQLDQLGTTFMSEGQAQAAAQQALIDAAGTGNQLSAEQIAKLTQLQSVVQGLYAQADSAATTTNVQLFIANANLSSVQLQLDAANAAAANVASGIDAAKAALVIAQGEAAAYLAQNQAEIADIDPVPALLHALPANIAAALAPLINGVAGSGFDSERAQIIRNYAASLPQDQSGALQLYQAAVANGVGSAELDAALGMASGSAAAFAAANGLPAFAKGGMHDGGWRLVGEHGPEIETTGPARYFSAEQTRGMLHGGGAGGGNEALTRELLAEVKALRAEVKSLREQSLQGDLVNAQATERNTQVLASTITESASRADRSGKVRAQAVAV